MKEIIEELNNLKIHQKSIDFLEDLPEDVYKRHFKGKQIYGEIDIQKHRWYETSISIFEIPEGHIGVRSITDIKRESNEVGDMFHHLKFYELEPVLKTTYKVKNDV